MYEAFDHGEISSLNAIDLSKAFNTVTHKIFLDKLKIYGIKGMANSLL